MEKIKGTDFVLIKITEPKIRLNGTKRKMGLTRCKCGDEKIRDLSTIGENKIKSCPSCSIVRRSSKLKTHELIKHPLYRKWSDMKKRCYNPNVDRYKSYGALGITVCDDWKKNFISFYNWCMDNNWEDKLTIDRIDINKGYSPENCRLITMLEQGFNKRNTFFVNLDSNTKVGLSEILYYNDKSYLYHKIWHGLKVRDFSFFIKEYNLKTDFKYLSIKQIKEL